jgi:hypothetical protein
LTLEAVMLHGVTRRSLVWGLVISLSVAASGDAGAQAGDPQLRTDHPHFPGELAMSTPPRVVSTALAMPRGSLGNTTNRDKLIRLFLWRAEHYGHLHSPAIYNLPGVKPNPLAINQLMIDNDGMRALFSYGFGLCGTNHAQMRPFTEALGWTDRRVQLVNDTGYEILIDGKWRYVNADQYTLHFESNSSSSHFASLQQVITTNHHFIEWNPDIGLGHRLPQANTHGSYQNFAGVTGTVANRSLQWRDYYRNIWKVVPISSGGNYKTYGEGYAAAPIVYRLRRGETFTRWIDPMGVVTDLSLAGQLWWGYNVNSAASPKGPHVSWSFVQNAPARDEVPGGAEESLSNQRYGNGAYDWRPNLARGEHLDGAVAITGSLPFGGSPALRAAAASTLVFEQYTPYTIAARPADGIDPANAATDGAVITASAVGSVPVAVSVDGGATWASAGTLSGAGGRVDFTNFVKGRNQYLLRLSFDSGEGLDGLRLRTITMLNQGVFPNLKSGSAVVKYAASNVGALELSPAVSSAAADASTTGYTKRIGGSSNLTGVFHANGNAWALAGNNDSALQVVYRITMPPRLASAGARWKQIFAAFDGAAGVPTRAGTFGRIEIAPWSTGPWTQLSHYAPPTDNELSHFWTYGRSSDSTPLNPANQHYYVRFTSGNPGQVARMRFMNIYATYTLPAAASAIQVIYHWWNGANLVNTRTIPAGATSDTWTINTGANVAQRKVIIKIP